MTNLNRTTKAEILEQAYTSRAEARADVNRAVRHYREAKRATIQVMADLRKLQDGGVHLVYGYKNFAAWAEDTFDGLYGSSVKQLTRCGAVAIDLEKAGRLDLDKPTGVGTTGLRELSVISNEYGVEKMVEVFDTAKGMLEDERDVSETTVKAAMRLLMPPAPADLDIPEALEAGGDGEDEEDLAGEQDGLSEAMRERIERVRDLSWDLPQSSQELLYEMKMLEREKNGEPVPEDEEWLSKGR